MSNWHTLQVRCFIVYCSDGGRETPKEFNDFDEAAGFAQSMREKFPDVAVEFMAVIDDE